jgi:HlyD family secretion protein
VNSGIAPPPNPTETTASTAANLAERWRWALIVVVLLAAVFGFVLLRRIAGPRAQGIGVPSLPAASGVLSLRLNGKTEAVESRAILAPLIAGQQMGTLTIVKLVASGIRVKQGDLLVEFDRQAQLRDSIDKKAQSEDQNGKVLEAQAAEAATRVKDETDIETAQSALSKAELEMQKVELLSRIDAEKAREDLDEARATLTQLKETFDLKRKAAAASIRILEIQRDRTRETMLHAENNAALLQIRAPIDGIVVFNTIWKEGKMGEVQDGDQVRPGVPFMQVVNPALMQVHVSVNQEDLMALNIGQPAHVHLDAYPDMELEGRLDSIDPMGKRGDFSSKLRTFSATFSIQGSDARLMPDLSAAVDVAASDAASARGRAN